VRKALEAYFTVLIEAIWGKRRILEVYVNSIEWGNGIYGVEAASQEYFKKPASELTKSEAALLAAVLPNPRKWSPGKPTPYIKKRARSIQGRMGVAIPK
jgi:monofunctional biosynthetic peptidoglycan transglycosylase